MISVVKNTEKTEMTVIWLGPSRERLLIIKTMMLLQQSRAVEYGLKR